MVIYLKKSFGESCNWHNCIDKKFKLSPLFSSLIRGLAFVSQSTSLIRERAFLSPSTTKFISRSIHSFYQMAKYNVVFVLGGPGAGKGTQCQNIINMPEYGFVHLSAGDLLREERQRAGSQYGEEIENHIKNGTIVPVAITCSLLKRAMEQSGKKNFLIDGFPRNQDNLDGWTKTMTGVAVVKMVLFFHCSEQTCIQRCLDRGKTSGRSDDNEESLKKRVKTYNDSTMPVVQQYGKLKLVREINGDKEPDQVFEEVKKALAELML